LHVARLLACSTPTARAAERWPPGQTSTRRELVVRASTAPSARPRARRTALARREGPAPVPRARWPRCPPRSSPGRSARRLAASSARRPHGLGLAAQGAQAGVPVRGRRGAGADTPRHGGRRPVQPRPMTAAAGGLLAWRPHSWSAAPAEEAPRPATSCWPGCSARTCTPRAPTAGRAVGRADRTRRGPARRRAPAVRDPAGRGALRVGALGFVAAWAELAEQCEAAQMRPAASCTPARRRARHGGCSPTRGVGRGRRRRARRHRGRRRQDSDDLAGDAVRIARAALESIDLGDVPVDPGLVELDERWVAPATRCPATPATPRDLGRPPRRVGARPHLHRQGLRRPARPRRGGPLRPRLDVVFWHTGGVPGRVPPGRRGRCQTPPPRFQDEIHVTLNLRRTDPGHTCCP